MSALVHLRQGWLDAHQCLRRNIHVIQSGQANAVLSLDERASALQRLYAMTTEFETLLADHPDMGALSTDDRMVIEWIESLDGSGPTRAAA